MKRSISLGTASLAVAVATSACGDDRPRAIVAPDRSAHLFDRPFPSDELLGATGTVDLAGMPVAGSAIGQQFMTGWTRQVRETVFGFSPVMPVYLRFTSPVTVASTYTSAPGDPVQLYSLDSDHRVTVTTRVIDDDRGDPYLPSGLLALIPDEASPLRPGERYAAVVTTAIADAAPGYVPPAELAGVPDLAVATVFTVQDSARELRSLGIATDAYLAANPGLLQPIEPLREVASVRYAQGKTPSGKLATVETVRFADNTEAVTYLDDKPGLPERTIDVTTGPFVVYQAAIQTPSFQAATGRPYGSSGVGILNDTTRSDGWIHFDRTGAVLDTPTPERMRIVVQVPRGAGNNLVAITWGHGSGGDAYEAIARVNPDDRIDAIRSTLANAGAVVVSADLPLFGQRFELIDGGFSADQAFINIGNLPAFRDNPRQAAVDHHVLARFAGDVLPDLLPAGMLARGKVGMFGHSTGSQVAALVPVLEDGKGLRRLLLSGAGGYLAHYIVATDLVSIGDDIADLLFVAAGIPTPDPITPEALLGALLGVPESAWSGIDRHHPLALPFQMVVDGGDPLAVARAQPIDAIVFMGEGDLRTPNDSARWLAAAMPNGELATCRPGGSYDGHYCPLREPAALAEFTALVEAVREAP